MSMKKRLSSFAPALSAVLVAACIGVSLAGYTPEVYAVQTPEVTGSIEPVNENQESETGNTDSGKTASNASGVGQGSKTVEQVADAAAYKDGTYYGTATGFAGPLTVKVVISGGKISSIEVTETKDDASYLNRAKALISKIITRQSTNVDTVSGATYSSAGIINAVRNALAQAAISGAENIGQTGGQSGQNQSGSQNVTPAPSGNIPYVDGIYYGMGEGYGGDITVAVVIQNKTIKAVLITDAQYEDEVFFDRAKVVAENVVTAQSTKVDTVSGATYSSRGILEAIENALLEAKKATEGNKGNNSQNGGNTNTGNNGTDGSDENQADDSKNNENISTAQIYADGEYDIVVLCEPDEDEEFDPYNLSMKITIKGDRIVAVSDVAGDGDATNNTYIRKAVNGTTKYPSIISQVLALKKEELTDEKINSLDVISNATCTSNSIREACKAVLAQAKALLEQNVSLSDVQENGQDEP